MNTTNVGERESPHERNGRDSNPRAFRPPAFKAGAIVRSATVPAPEGSGARPAVWSALTDPEQLATWAPVHLGSGPGPHG